MDTAIMKTLQDATSHQMTNVETLCSRVDSEIYRLGRGDGFERLLDQLRRLIDKSALPEVTERLHPVKTKMILKRNPLHAALSHLFFPVKRYEFRSVA